MSGESEPVVGIDTDDRKPFDPIRVRIIHLEAKLEKLPKQCADRKLSPETEAFLTSSVRDELYSLRQMPLDNTADALLYLQEHHEELNDQRSSVILGEIEPPFQS